VTDRKAYPRGAARKARSPNAKKGGLLNAARPSVLVSPGCPPGGVRSDRADPRRLRPLRALGDLELHPLVFVQRAETGGVDRGVVGEDIGPTAVRGDEAVALLRDKPFDGTVSYSCFLLFLAGRVKHNAYPCSRRDDHTRHTLLTLYNIHVST